MFPSIARPHLEADPSVTPEALAAAVMEYLGAEDPGNAARVLDQRPILLNDEALAFLDGMIALARRGEDANADGVLLGNWERLRQQLDDSITEGVYAAVERARNRGDRDAELAREYLQLPPEELREYVERRRSVLLDENMMHRIRLGAEVLARGQEPVVAEMLELRLRFLRDARDHGITTAWAAFLQGATLWYASGGSRFGSTAREE